MDKIEQKINKVLDKLTMDERRYLAQMIGCECNYFLANYLKPRSNARMEAICDFTLYLQEKFDHLNEYERMNKAMDKVLGITPPYLTRVK